MAQLIINPEAPQGYANLLEGLQLNWELSSESYTNLIDRGPNQHHPSNELPPESEFTVGARPWPVGGTWGWRCTVAGSLSFQGIYSQQPDRLTWWNTTSNDQFTTSLWWFKEEHNTNRWISFVGPTNSNDFYVWALRDGSMSQFQFYLRYGGSSSTIVNSGSTGIPVGTWSLLTCVLRHVGGLPRQELWLDDQKVGDIPGEVYPSYSPNYERRIAVGSNWRLTGQAGVAGVFGNYRAWNRALSDAEIAQLYRLGPGLDGTLVQRFTSLPQVITETTGYQGGVNFRSTTSYVTDGPRDVPAVSTSQGDISYPPGNTKNNAIGDAVTYGWNATNLVDFFNVDASPPTAELAGAHGVAFDSGAIFRLDLPQPGIYDIDAAFGAQSAGVQTDWEIRDGDDFIIQFISSQSQGADTWRDANNIDHASGLDWISNRSFHRYTFVNSYITVRPWAIASPGDHFIAHLSITEVLASPTADGDGDLQQLEQTIAGAGTVVNPNQIAGNAALVQNVQQIAGAGTYTPVPINLTGDLQQQVQEISGSGTVEAPGEVSGNAALSQDVQVITGVGTVIPAPGNATAALQQLEQVISGAGTVTAPGEFSGNAALAQQEQQISGTGTIIPAPGNADAVLTQQEQQITGVGTITLPGVVSGNAALAQQLQLITGIGDYVEPPANALASLIQAEQTISGSGTVGIPGQISGNGNLQQPLQEIAGQGAVSSVSVPQNAEMYTYDAFMRYTYDDQQIYRS